MGVIHKFRFFRCHLLELKCKLQKWRLNWKNSCKVQKYSSKYILNAKPLTCQSSELLLQDILYPFIYIYILTNISFCRKVVFYRRQRWKQLFSFLVPVIGNFCSIHSDEVPFSITVNRSIWPAVTLYQKLSAIYRRQVVFVTLKQEKLKHYTNI